MEFYRNRKKSVNLLLIYTGILILMVLILLYSIGILSDSIIAKGIALSSIFILIFGFTIIRTLISLNDKSPLIVLTPEGITARVTAVSKAAGLISWKDITDMEVGKAGGDTLITLVICNAEPYKLSIRKKLSAIALDNAKDPGGDLYVYLTASVLDIDAYELFNKIKTYKAQVHPAIVNA
ncbi:hypothetical protein HDE68_001140 [Pedobacter cryoconitis]|uniref:Uncharacterized protein n=1 Tax=Pedobacter cryoconitis TaxID=188932 RepID=A0A7W8ZJZ1_9SPHI|nr:STM3941 family protein [Pedobacter cryoconitis]MBB5635255.1 hypothetical protein [Pedobacter cryoconitis]